MAKSNNTTGSVRTKPILFSAPMVRALLEGRKTQTRRVIKDEIVINSADNIKVVCTDTLFYPVVAFSSGHCRRMQEIKPKYALGDLLWVREKLNCTHNHGISYDADGEIAQDEEWQWKNENLPAMFMPRWASRLTLRVTDVRAQRLFDISDADAEAEGFKAGLLNDGFGPKDIGGGWTMQSLGGWASASGMFQKYWSELYPDWDGFSDPWVWAYSFEVIKQNVDEVA